MSTTPQTNNESQEIDFSQLSKKISGFFESILTLIFNGILFVKRNIIVIGILFILGVGLGVFLDRNKVYDNQIIVTPNFSAVDYLYSKIDLINSKVNENDTLFLKNVVGIKNTKAFRGIEVEPITDIYKFIGANPVNFELVKLMAEDGEIDKIVDDKLTSKNYVFHNITFSTSKPTSQEQTVKPILAYLNDTDYYKKIQKEFVNNINLKMKANDSIIKQIDGILNSFSNTAAGSSKSNNLVYYNENTQLNEVIKTKNELVAEQGAHRLELVGLDKIIKESSVTTNIRNNKGVNGKMKLIVPLVFLFLFFGFSILRKLYKKQLAKPKE